MTRSAGAAYGTAALLSCFLSCFSFLSAQAPTFRTGTTLVEFTVVAQDGEGNPVVDLMKEELELADRGEPREIAFFRFDGGPAAGASAGPPPPLSPGFVSNRPEYQREPHRNVTALVLDWINTAPADHVGARNQLMRYMKALPSNSPVGLFRFTDQTPMVVLQPFTTRVDLMRSKLGELDAVPRRELVTPGSKGAVSTACGGGSSLAGGRGGMAGAATPGAGGRRSATMSEGMSAFRESETRVLTDINAQVRRGRLGRTTASLEALGQYLAGFPGRKSIIWITGGMPIQLKAVLKGRAPDNFEPAVRALAQSLANQGIAVYPVDAHGGCRAGDRANSPGLDGLDDPPQDVFGTFDVLADVTGGRVTKYDNNLSKGLALAANDLRGTYTIGFYTSDEPDDRWHPIRLGTSRRGVALRHRQGYLSAARLQPQSLTPDEWSQLARSPLGSSGIRLNGRPTLTGGRVAVILQIAAGDLYFHSKDRATMADLEVALVEQVDNGATNVRYQPLEITLGDPADTQRSPLITSVTTWPVQETTTAVRVIVRDRMTRRYGSVDLKLVR